MTDFAEIAIDYEASILDEERAPAIRLSDSFLKDPALAARMVMANDGTAFALYLLLLKNFDGNPEGSVDISAGNPKRNYRYVVGILQNEAE